MDGESLCVRTFAETFRKRMSKQAQIKNFNVEANVFLPGRNGASKNLSHVFEFYKLLLDSIVYVALENGEDGIPDIDAPMASQLKNGSWEIHRKIKEIAQRKSSKAAVVAFFDANLIPNIPSSVCSSVLGDIDTLVQNSSDVAKRKKTSLRQAYQQKKSDASYLADVWLFAVCNGTNKQEESQIAATDATASKKAVTPFETIKRAEALLATLPAPQQVEPPEQPLTDEQTYICELYAAYGDKEGIADFSKAHLPHYVEYNEDLKERRIDYFAAESIRRGVEELYLGEYANQFDILKSETLAGVKNTARRSFSNGYERMLSVMEQAVLSPVRQYLLGQSPYWISNRIKMGVCHFLVNENKLKWVNR